MTDGSADWFEAEVALFVTEIEDLVQGVFNVVPAVSAEIGPGGFTAVMSTKIDLAPATGGEPLAQLNLSYQLCPDSNDKYLAVRHSSFQLLAKLERNPIMRVEYDRRSSSKPSAHIQVHAQRGALAHILSQSGHPSPHLMEKLHLPVGGDRFRPCLEDFLQFLIDECRLAAAPGAHEAIYAGRMRWREIQTRAVVRDSPSNAAEVLRTLGYHVEEPAEGAEPTMLDRLKAW